MKGVSGVAPAAGESKGKRSRQRQRQRTKHTRWPGTGRDVAEFGVHVDKTGHTHPSVTVLGHSRALFTDLMCRRAEGLTVQPAPFSQGRDGLIIASIRAKYQLPLGQLSPAPAVQRSSPCVSETVLVKRHGQTCICPGCSLATFRRRCHHSRSANERNRTSVKR